MADRSMSSMGVLARGVIARQAVAIQRVLLGHTVVAVCYDCH